MDRALRPIANVRGGDGEAALGTSEKKLYPKESALIDPVAAERMDFITVTRNPCRVTVMKSDAVAPDKREAWVEDKVKRGIDVLICHPRLVQETFRRTGWRPSATAGAIC